MITGNKGEWSELYALFKLLGDGKLIPGDKNLNEIHQLFFPILKIIKNEIGEDFHYQLNNDLVIIINNNHEFKIPIQDFRSNAIKLLKKIKSESGAFSYPEIEDFMYTFKSTKLKAKSTSKSDIRIIIHDIRINQTADLGFSIKSELGGDSTLLNAGDTTNFIYEVKGYNFTNKEIDEINSINSRSKIKDRINAILNKKATIHFQKPNKDVFKNNLVLIDSLLPNLLAEIIYLYYTSSNNSLKDLTKVIQSKNPLNYDTSFSHAFYEYKIKRFLTDIAQGMMPSFVWSGTYDATGGHLIVKTNGDVLCYHIYNRNDFEDYLFFNTRLETASSSRHRFGSLYQDENDNKFYLKLNLQIRFSR